MGQLSETESVALFHELHFTKASCNRRHQLHLENGFLPVNENMQTEISDVYAVGDICVKQVRQVSTAVAYGTITAIHTSQNHGEFIASADIDIKCLYEQNTKIHKP